MILGVGADICEVAAVARGLGRGEAFLRGLFTPAERAAATAAPDPEVQFARLFAAKEALAKALGIGFGERLGWRDFEIHAPPGVPPSVTVTGGGARRLTEMGGCGEGVRLSWFGDAVIVGALAVLSRPDGIARPPQP